MGGDHTLEVSFEELPQVLSGKNPNQDIITKDSLPTGVLN